MKLLRFFNDDIDVDVQYKTDLIAEDATNFTVMEIVGLSDDELELGIDFQKLPYNLPAFIQFAEENGLGLSIQEIGTPVDKDPEILVEPEVVS